MASQIETLYLGGNHRVWFSSHLNPIANGESANPLSLYAMIDKAVKLGDVDHAKLKDLKATLLLLVSRLIKPKDRRLACWLKRDILRAPLEMYRPQLWRLDLLLVDVSRWETDGATPDWDEQYVVDLRKGEFEIIVE